MDAVALSQGTSRHVHERHAPGLAPQIPIKTEVKTFPLDRTNEALARLRGGRSRGAGVLMPG